MTRAIKIEWKKRKERGTCSFSDIGDNLHFRYRERLYCRVASACVMFSSTPSTSNERTNAICVDDGCPALVLEHELVQPVTIRKVVLRK